MQVVSTTGETSNKLEIRSLHWLPTLAFCVLAKIFKPPYKQDSIANKEIEE